MQTILPTPLGPMLAVVDEKGLSELCWSFEAFQEKAAIQHPVFTLLQKELALYFAGKLQSFTVPLSPIGTAFQQTVWQALQAIPFGTACSYKELASAIGKPTAYRAVAQANGANPLPILIPCHRVINSDGKLGGYNAGLERKRWLLKHEKIS